MSGFGGTDLKKINRKSVTDGAELLEEAVNAHKLGQLQLAEKLYLKAINSGFRHEIAFSNLGVIYKNSGRTQEALAIYEQAISINPNFFDAYINLGNLFKQVGKLDEALTSTQKSLQLEPDNAYALCNLGEIYKDLGQLDEALSSTLKSLEIKNDNSDAHMNLGGIFNHLGKYDEALVSTLKSLELNPDNSDAFVNLSIIYKNLGNYDQALVSVLKSLDLNFANPGAHTLLGSIYHDLGNLDLALQSTLKALELNPQGSTELCKLGLIKLSLGQTNEAREHLFDSVEINYQECEAYHALSIMLETNEEAEALIDLIKLVQTSRLTPQRRSFVEFALSNCYHKIKNFSQAANHLLIANQNKLIASPSNSDYLQKQILLSVSKSEFSEISTINSNWGKDRIFIVGLPRCGSTLLETILSIHPHIKDLGETKSLDRAISKLRVQGKSSSIYQHLHSVYSQFEPITSEHKYSTDKHLYNFMHINHILSGMPSSKIIHCRRNPLDHILSMYRSYLSIGNGFTSSLAEAAKVLIAHEQALDIQKKKYPQNIYTFDYDQFVCDPERNLRELLGWLRLEFDANLLHPEQSGRSINTASIIQVRRPISKQSVGGWKNYENLLQPAISTLYDYFIKSAIQYANASSFDDAANFSIKAIELNNKSEEAYLMAAKYMCEQELFKEAKKILESAKKIIPNSHMIDGELVRIKFLVDLFNPQ